MHRCAAGSVQSIREKRVSMWTLRRVNSHPGSGRYPNDGRLAQLAHWTAEDSLGNHRPFSERPFNLNLRIPRTLMGIIYPECLILVPSSIERIEMGH